MSEMQLLYIQTEGNEIPYEQEARKVNPKVYKVCRVRKNFQAIIHFNNIARKITG